MSRKIDIKEFDLLNLYRKELMGIAIILIMLFHSSININIFFDSIKKVGYFGVDIFLLLSGIGIYYSYNKCANLKMFYKRRILRILPTYLPIVLVYSIFLRMVKAIDTETIFYNLSMLSFWINEENRFDWYVPAIMVLYLFSPLLIALTNDSRRIKKFIIFSLLFNIVIIILNLNYLLIFTTRIPIFFVGMVIAKKINENRSIKINNTIFNIIFVVGIVLLVVFFKYLNKYLWKYGLYWYPFILITPAFCFYLSKGFNYISKRGKSILNIIKWFGEHSLELYLFHFTIYRVIIIFTEYFCINISIISINLINFIFSILSSILWKRMLNFSQKNIDRLNNKTKVNKGEVY